jgi:putative component of toxin-antitoxin plasmid stabilization module
MKTFIDGLTDEQAAAVVAAMKDVAQNGLAAARHLRGEIYEVRAEAERQAFRILFAQETTFILLSLSGFQKKSASTPPVRSRSPSPVLLTGEVADALASYSV